MLSNEQTKDVLPLGSRPAQGASHAGPETTVVTPDGANLGSLDGVRRSPLVNPGIRLAGQSLFEA